MAIFCLYRYSQDFVDSFASHDFPNFVNTFYLFLTCLY